MCRCPRSNPARAEQGTCVSWMRKDALPDQEQWQSIRKALGHQQHLLRSIDGLQQQCAGGSVDAVRLSESVQQLQQDAAGLETFFSGFLKPVFYTERPPAQQPEGTLAAVERVFELPELLDMVLQYLNIPEILSFQQINRTAKSSIDNSPRIQAKLSLRADEPGAPLREPFMTMLHPRNNAFWCKTTRPRSCVGSREPVSQKTVSARFTDNANLPRIGETYRRMFVMQPPIYEMVVSPQCCVGKRSAGEEGMTVKSATGLTIGDIHDAAKRVQEDHRMCTYAAYHLHDDEGFVQAHPTFTAKVDVPVPPRAPAPSTPDANEQSRRRDAQRLKHGRIGAYMAYKQQKANENDIDSILTLKEFEDAGLHAQYAGQMPGSNTGVVPRTAILPAILPLVTPIASIAPIQLAQPTMSVAPVPPVQSMNG